MKSVAGLELKAISPCFFLKLQITHIAFSARLICKTFRNKVDRLYRITTIFWSHIVYLRGELLIDNLDPPWYQVLITCYNISELNAYMQHFCKLPFSKLIHFPSDLDRGPTTRHQILSAYSVTYLLNICQLKHSLNVFHSNGFSRQKQSENDLCRTSVFPHFLDPARAISSRARSRYTSCSIVVLFLASMMCTAADNVGKLKNSRDMVTHPCLAEQSYGNIHHGGFLLLVFTLLLACSLPKALEILKRWLTRSHGCHDLDAVQQTRDTAAAAAERERRLMDDKRQSAVLAAAVKDHRMAREELHPQRQDDVSYTCDLGTDVHALCAKAKRIAAIESACGGDLDSVRAFGTVIQHLGDFVPTWRPKTRVTHGVHVDTHPDLALLCAQIVYRAEHRARESGVVPGGVHTTLSVRQQHCVCRTSRPYWSVPSPPDLCRPREDDRGSRAIACSGPRPR